MNLALLVGGATGLVGAEVLRLAVTEGTWNPITAVVRRVPEGADRRVTWCIADYERLGSAALALRADVVVGALGTTIRQAGSQAAFRHVDFDYSLALAERALAHGARHFLLVSSLGADPRSRVFYSRVKGEIEAAINALPYDRVTIVRPSFLVGHRPEPRRGEALVARFGWLLPSSVRPVSGTAVARTILSEARNLSPGRVVVRSGAMQAMRDT